MSDNTEYLKELKDAYEKLPEDSPERAEMQEIYRVLKNAPQSREDLTGPTETWTKRHPFLHWCIFLGLFYLFVKVAAPGADPLVFMQKIFLP